MADEMEQIRTEFIVDGKPFTVEFWLCADHKFLALERGIMHANCSHPCIYCAMASADFWKWREVIHQSSRSKEEAAAHVNGKKC
jgi:hypothetical protein